MKLKISIILLLTTFGIFLPRPVLCQTDKQLSIHGYLTQGFGITNGHQVLGISEQLTSDYRNMALQFRYDVDFRHAIVVQFSHKRLGNSPLMKHSQDINLDWGFVEYWFSGSTQIKVGKVQLPFGIYNELRDVGTVLPFYRVPEAFYQEGNFVSETINGIVLTQKIGSYPWNVEFDLCGGDFDSKESEKNPVTGQDMVVVIPMRIFGAQMSLNTPFHGLRLGIGSRHGKNEDGVKLSKGTFKTLNLFVDGDFEQFSLKFEVRDVNHTSGFDFTAAYGEAGIQLTKNFKIYLMKEWNNFNIEVPTEMGNTKFNIKLIDDYVLGLNYSLNPQIMLKAEGHWSKRYFIEDKAVNYLLDDPAKVFYSIVSLSTSF